MIPERFRRMEAVFDAAADAPEGERAAVLDRLCSDDAPLRAEVEALLAASFGATEQIEGTIGRAARRVATDLGAAGPRRLGPYRLERELGQGGMGAVYLAVRDDDEYRTQVAIKLLHHGLETAQSVARFRDERQILASLEHPGIVRLLDGGSTPERLPYLVMEHVEGAPITLWANARELPVRARVELFLKVCAAVAYAHQKLVVHRDLKPSNILVTTDGSPKLLDFGIAKLLDPEAGREAVTRTGMRLLTPEYASPEQVRGERVSISTDVYALGAVLYELLSGAQAQRVQGEGLEALRAILEVDPPRPSAVAPADRRRAIAGDLDNVVLKALHKDPARRYASVEQLAEDLQRHLDGLPVLARAGTWTYRVGKLVRRRRGVVAALAVVLLSLSAATGVSVRQARRADVQARRADEEARRAHRRFEDVRRLANALLFEVDGKIASLEGSTEARELIVRRALEYLDGLAGEAGDDAALSRELASAYVKVGEIQGNSQVPNLGHPRDGLESYSQAKRILDGLIASGHGDVATRWVLVKALFGIAKLSWETNDVERARESGRAAIEVVATLPADRTFEHGLVARGYAVVDDLALDDGDAALAVHLADACLDVATRWERAEPSPEARYWMGLGHSMRARAFVLAGDPERVASEIRESAAIFAILSVAEPENAPYRRETWLTHMTLATVFSGAGDAKLWIPRVEALTDAEGEARAALSLAEEQVRRDARDTRAALQLGVTLDLLSVIVAERDPAGALPSFDRARAVFAGLPRSIRDLRYARQFQWFGQCAMAVSLAKQGRRAEALAAITSGLDIAETDAAGAGASLDGRMSPSMCRFQAARTRRALGDDAAAVELLEQTAAALRALLAARPATLVPYLGLVETLEIEAALQPERRCALLDEAAAAWRSWPGTPTPYTRRRQAEIDAARADCR